MNLPESKYFVYALVDPINQTPFYIGKGCGNRPYTHLRDKEKVNADKIRYIKNIRMLGFEPEVHYIIKNLCEKEAYKYENVFIQISKNYNIILTNKVGIKQPPSRKGCKMSEKAKKAISEALRKRVRKPMSAEQKQKISATLKGRRKEDRLIIDREKLYDMYVLQNMTKKQVANIYNVSLEPINRNLKEYNIRKVSFYK